MSKRLPQLRALVFVVAAVILGSTFYGPKAAAYACDGWYGRGCWRGYFDNVLDTGINPPGSDVIIGGMQGIRSNDKAGFIARVEGYFNSPDQHLHTSGSFMILSMAGHPGGTSRTVTAAEIADWESRIENPAVSMRVEFAPFVCGEANTYYQRPENDIAAGTATVSEGCGANDEMIDFYDTSQPGSPLVYRIRVACGNPLGVLPGLRPYNRPRPIPTTLTCGTVRTDPDNPEVGQRLTVKATVNVATGANTPVTAGDMTITDAQGNADNPPVNRSSSGNTVNISTQNYMPADSGWYTVTWSATVNGVSISCGGDFKPYSSFDAQKYPFFSVGGDVVSGIGFATTTSTGTVACTAAPHNQKAGISSWNRSGNPDFNGAGAQYAAMAMNYLQGFASDTQVGGGGLNLSFSNASQRAGSVGSTDVAGNSLFGGMFGGVQACVDYWNNKPDMTAPNVVQLGPSMSALDMNGTYYRSGDLVLSSGTIQDDSHVTIYVDGNVQITGAITYANSGWTDVAHIPTFRLIVHGAIFIDSNVDRLDGTYVAVPDHYDPTDPQTTANSFTNPQPGTITTCGVRNSSPPFLSYDPRNAAGNGMIAACNSQLVVYGSFIANQLYLLRTAGTVGSNQPAEVFDQSPDMWLAPSSEDRQSAPRYQAVIALPPVL